MMPTRTTATEALPENVSSGGENKWETRPGGMLVQKRTPYSDQNPLPNIRVRVKYGSLYHEIHISAQATFGELKKMLSGPTGVHHEDQKLLFKDKERDSKMFLDVVGVKDKSKIVLVEDPIGQEKRILEMRRNAKMEKVLKFIMDISLEVDRLGGQVSAYKSVISKGGKVEEKQLVTLVELLMNQLIKLDGIVVDGDVKLQRGTQVTRVQRFVETLDMLKVKNSMPCSVVANIAPNHEQQQSPAILDMLNAKSSMTSSNKTGIQLQSGRYSGDQVLSPTQPQQSVCAVGHSPVNLQQQAGRHSASGPVVITTQWETFDPVPTLIMSTTPTASNAVLSNNTAKHPQFTWDLL